ncbi:MAG: TRAP transporter large permease subunit [Desulfobacterales bacterium]|nr:TRAP transporter large permease subunit [Desulfobacterales bacterium]
MKRIFFLAGKGIDWIIPVSIALAGCMLLLMTFVTAYEVFVRYLFNSPTSWTLDFAVYMLIGFAYCSMVYVESQDRHIRVDLLLYQLSPRTRWIWEIATKIIFLIFILLLIYFSTEFAYDSYENKEYAWTMWYVLTWPAKSAVPFGGALLGLYLIKEIIEKIAYLRTNPLERGKGILDNPKVILPVFFAFIALSIYLMSVNAIVGMILLLLVMLFGAVPIFPALGLVGIIGYYLVFGGLGAVRASFPAVSYLSLETFALVCLPLFVLIGQLLQSSGTGDELYELSTKWFGHLPAGEGIATILACSVFAAISASSVSTAATVGLVAIPALIARKYNKNLSYGLLAAGGTLGTMIPPSGSMIIYSMVTEESLGKLFMAGVIPGLILATGFIVYTILFCSFSSKSEYQRQPAASWGERYDATKKAIWGLLAPVIVLGGIYSGVFTPLESGAIAVVYGLAMVLIRRKVTLRQLPGLMAHSTLASTMVLSIIVGALVLGDLMTLLKLPDEAMNLVQSMHLSRWTVIIIIMGMYMVLGMFLELVSCLLITLPVVYPLVTSLGFDGIWFAVMVTLNMEMAQITPPVGLNLYVVTGIAQTKLFNVLKGVFPFFIIMVLAMIIFAIFPSLSTWLPSTMVGGVR